MNPPAFITTVVSGPPPHPQHPQHQQSSSTTSGLGGGGDAFAPPTVVTPSAASSPEDDALVHGQWRHMTRTLYHYERLEQIGEGTYGQVYRAVCRDTGRQVALKKMRLHHGGYWGMPLQLVREIKILKRLRHPNLLQMLEVVTSKGVEHLDEDDEHSQDAAAANAAAANAATAAGGGNNHNKDGTSKQDRVSDAREAYKGNLFLVLEYISHDLTGLLDVGHVFDDRAVKTIMMQLFRAVAYLHENKYVHRDIKSSNILIDSHHRLKLADFGLARCLEPPILDQVSDRASTLELTNKVITLWYRPPEILLGSTSYTTVVDVWSAGCILAELCLNRPLFSGKTEVDQLSLIADALGTPGDDTIAHLTALKRVRSGEMNFPPAPRKSKLEKYSNKMKPEVIALLHKTLEWDPRKRVTAANALSQRYFRTQPLAAEDPSTLPPISGPHFHEFQTKKKRKEAKAVAEKAKDDLLAVGMSEEEARGEFDKVYRSLMKKVALEGLGTSVKASPKKSVGAKHPSPFPPPSGAPSAIQLAGIVPPFPAHPYSTLPPTAAHESLPFPSSQPAGASAAALARPDGAARDASTSRSRRKGEEGRDHDRRRHRDERSLSPRSDNHDHDHGEERHRRRKHERRRSGDAVDGHDGGESKRRSSSKRADRDEDRRHRSSPLSERDPHHRPRRPSREKERDRGGDDDDDADRHHRKSKRREKGDHDRDRGDRREKGDHDRDRGDRRRSSKKPRREKDDDHDDVRKSASREDDRARDRPTEGRGHVPDEPVGSLDHPQRLDSRTWDGPKREDRPVEASRPLRSDRDNELRRIDERPRDAAPEVVRRVGERPDVAAPDAWRVDERPRDFAAEPRRADERPRGAAPEFRRADDRPQAAAPQAPLHQDRDDDRSRSLGQAGGLAWHPPSIPHGQHPPHRDDRPRPVGGGGGGGGRGNAPPYERVDQQLRAGRGGDGRDRPRSRSPPGHRPPPGYADRSGRGAYGGGGGGGGYEGRGDRGAGDDFRRGDRDWDRGDRDRRPGNAPPPRSAPGDRDHIRSRFVPPQSGPSREHGSRDGPEPRGAPLRDDSYGPPPRSRQPPNRDGGDLRGWQPPRDRDNRR